MIPLSDIGIALNWLIAIYACSFIGILLLMKDSQLVMLRYAIGKSLGVIVIAATSWVLSLLHILAFSFLSLWLLVFIFLVIILLLKRRHIFNNIRYNWQTYLLIEVIFLGLFVTGIFLRATHPKIEGVEDFMDSAILSNLIRHQKGVPIDTWFAPNSINYYYFGQWLIATIAKLSRTGINYAFNLGLATVLALAGTSVFALAWQLTKHKMAGLLAIYLTFFASNLQPLIALLTGVHNYNFFSAGRFTATLINEYPFYSLVLGDIHAHFLALVISLAFYGVIALMFLENKIKFKDRIMLTILGGGLVGLLAITNTFDVLNGLIIFGLVMISFWFYDHYDGPQITKLSITFVLTASIMAALFLLNFKPPVGGIGIAIMKVPLKYLLWQFGLPIGLSVIAWLAIRRRMKLADDSQLRLMFIFGFSGLVLIFIAEFVFLKDIYYYQNPPYKLANTVFKTWYSAWPLIALSTAVLVTQAIYRLTTFRRLLMIGVTVIVCIVLGIGTVDGVRILNDGEPTTLNGFAYLKTSNASELAVVDWANQNIKGQPIVVQASGESYSPNSWFSSYTGLPSPLGWMAHEWTWRYNADAWTMISARNNQIQLLYEAPSVATLEQQVLILKAQYVLIGPDELKAYRINQETFKSAFGLPIYINGLYSIYKV